MLVGEEAACAAIAALDFVKNEQCACLAGHFTKFLQKIVVDHADAGYALYSLDYHGGEFAGGEFTLHGLDVVERRELDIGSAVDRRLDFGVVGGGHSSRSAAVECLVECQNFAAAGGERCQLHGVLVGFGARVGQEELVIIVARNLTEEVGQPLLQRVFDRVAVEWQTGHLLAHSLDIARMGMTD